MDFICVDKFGYAHIWLYTFLLPPRGIELSILKPPPISAPDKIRPIRTGRKCRKMLEMVEMGSEKGLKMLEFRYW